MSVLDPPVITAHSYRDALAEDENADPSSISTRREIPGEPGLIQKCDDCGRWGNIDNCLFSHAGWVRRLAEHSRTAPLIPTFPATQMDHNRCIACHKHERARQKSFDCELRGHKPNELAMWIAHFDETVHEEVGLLQLGLLVDHNKFLSHDVAERVIDGERSAGRRSWIKDLKNRIHDSGGLPTLSNTNISTTWRQELLELRPRTPEAELPRQSPQELRLPTDTMHHFPLNQVRIFHDERMAYEQLANHLQRLQPDPPPPRRSADTTAGDVPRLERQDTLVMPPLFPLDDMHVTWSPGLRTTLLVAALRGLEL
ncbi:hypothetical protein P7C70_g4463, partial [Phenoliferia sp. Uapishka_3]